MNFKYILFFVTLSAFSSQLVQPSASASDVSLKQELSELQNKANKGLGSVFDLMADVSSNLSTNKSDLSTESEQSQDPEEDYKNQVIRTQAELISSLKENRQLAQVAGNERVILQMGSISNAVGSICTAIVAVHGVKKLLWPKTVNSDK